MRIGVDLGSGAVKLLGATVEARAVEIRQLACEPLPELVDPANGSTTHTVVEVLERMVRACDLARAEVVLGISAQDDTFVKPIELPLMTAEELAEQMPWEAEVHLPFDINDMVIGYQLAATAPQRGQMTVLLVAAKKDRVSWWIEVARRAELRPVACTLDAVALAGWLSRSSRGGFVPTTVVDLGASKSALTVCSADGAIQFFRTIGSGGESVTRQLADRLGIARGEAEERKLDFAPGAPTTGSYRSHRPADDGLVGQIVEEANDQLTGATRRTVDFVIGLDKPIQRVLVTGGTERLPDLTQQLGRRLSCPVEPWPGDSIDAVRVGTGVDQALLRRWSRQLGVALGLCIDPRPTLQVPGLGAQRGLGGWLRSLLG